MDKERIDGFRSAFAPGETLFWQVSAAARERMAFYSENLPRLEALRDGAPCDAGIVLSAWLRCKEHAAVPFWAGFGAVAANTGLNDLLIFGKLGAPAMGVTGAAIATLVSQLLNLLLILIGFAVCLQKEAERPLTVEIWTRWAGVLCLFSEYNGEPDLLFRLAQVKSAAIGDGHVQLIERTGGKFRYSLAVLVCDRPQCRIDLY